MSIEEHAQARSHRGGTSEVGVRRAVDAAVRGESTRLESNGWLGLEAAQSLAIRLAEREGVSDYVTSYVSEDAVYIGPRKRRQPPATPPLPERQRS